MGATLEPTKLVLEDQNATNKVSFNNASGIVSITPATDDTGGIYFGNGTTDFDVKIFLGSTDNYVLFDKGNSVITLKGVNSAFGANTAGVDVQAFGATTDGASLLWDASDDQLEFTKTSIEMTGVLADEGLDSPYIGIGTSASSIEITSFADHVLGIGTWLKLKKNAAFSLLGGYFKVETDGSTDVADAQLVAVAPRVTVDMNLDSAYGVQSHMTISGTKTSSELISVSAYVDLASGQRTADRVCALQAMISGSGTAGTVDGDCFVAYIANRGTVITTDAIVNIHNQSSATAVDAIRMDLNGTVTYAFKFNGTVCDGWTSGTGALTGADDYVLIPVRVEGVAQDLFIKAQKTWS